MFKIIDTQTKGMIGKLYISRSRAKARADKLDNEYGAYRYAVVNIDLENFIRDNPVTATVLMHSTDHDGKTGKCSLPFVAMR